MLELVLLTLSVTVCIKPCILNPCQNPGRLKTSHTYRQETSATQFTHSQKLKSNTQNVLFWYFIYFIKRECN